MTEKEYAVTEGLKNSLLGFLKAVDIPIAAKLRKELESKKPVEKLEP